MPSNSSLPQQALDIAVNAQSEIANNAQNLNSKWLFQTILAAIQMRAQNAIPAVPSSISSSPLTAVDVPTTTAVSMPQP